MQRPPLAITKIADVPGSVDTIATVINNSGELAGLYIDSNGTGHSFIYNDEGHITTDDVPGAITTSTQAINNRGEIVGGYYDSKGGHGFIYKGGKFTTINAPD